VFSSSTFSNWLQYDSNLIWCYLTIVYPHRTIEPVEMSPSSIGQELDPWFSSFLNWALWHCHICDQQLAFQLLYRKSRKQSTSPAFSFRWVNHLVSSYEPAIGIQLMTTSSAKTSLNESFWGGGGHHPLQRPPGLSYLMKKSIWYSIQSGKWHFVCLWTTANSDTASVGAGISNHLRQQKLSHQS